MTMQAGNFADLLEPGLRQVYDTAVNRPMPVMEALYQIERSTKLTEHYEGLGATGLVPVFTGTVPYEQIKAYYRTDITNVELVQGMAVERRLLDDDQYGAIIRRARNLGDSSARTIEHDAVQTFINAFTAGGTNRIGSSTNGADGVALCSTAHPDGPADSGDTQSNTGTLALNVANVNTTRQLMLNFNDDQGNLLGIDPDICLVPAELEQEAIKVFGAKAIFQPDSAEFNVNMFAGKMTVMMWNRLTDANAWFLIDSVMMKRFLIWQWRIRPEFAQADDFDGIQAKFRTYMRYGIGWTYWNWIFGQNPS